MSLFLATTVVGGDNPSENMDILLVGSEQSVNSFQFSVFFMDLYGFMMVSAWNLEEPNMNNGLAFQYRSGFAKGPKGKQPPKNGRSP